MTSDSGDSSGEYTSEEVISHAISLRQEAKQANERRLLVLAGDNRPGLQIAQEIIDNLDICSSEVTFVGLSRSTEWERVNPKDADELLGTTRSAIVFDTHDALFPNALGRVFGAVDGGGLLILVTPTLDEWPERRDDYDDSLAAPPYGVEDVTGHFKSRVVEKLRKHSGITIIDVNSHTIKQDGRTGSMCDRSGSSSEVKPDGQTFEYNPPTDTAFPDVAYEACLTKDQANAVNTFEHLLESEQAIVVEADRGRGKSSAAGIAAGVFAARGETVAVTAPRYRSAREIFRRAKEVLSELDSLGAADGPEDSPRRLVTQEASAHGPSINRGPATGSVSYIEPTAIKEATAADILIVDEAAALPVKTLDSFLDTGRVAFATTIHGYEGAGRGFSVRFKSKIADSELTVSEIELEDPIRYAARDSVEQFAYQTLALNASPPPSEAVAGATPEDATFRAISSSDLSSDDELLQEVMGLLVNAHYRTEPDDLARILDAPDVSLRGLFHNGHLVSVLYFSTEGGLSVDERNTLYEGGRIQGHLVPSILIKKLRDKEAGSTSGVRFRRLTTHHALQSIGLGSALVEQTHQEFADEVDWFGGGYGLTPKLAYFWIEKGYDPVQLSTSRHKASGKYSVLILQATEDAGEPLHKRHTKWFRKRIASKLSSSLSDLNPDAARPILRTISPFSLDFNTHDWRIAADAAYGPAEPETAPRVFRQLTLRYFSQCNSAYEDGETALELSSQEERLLVSRVLQGNDWNLVLDRTGYSSKERCKQDLKNALKPLVDYYGDETVQEAKRRFSD